MEKRPIASTLRKMKVNDAEVFPITQRASLVNTIYNNLSGLRAEGVKFSIKQNLQEKVVTIKRTN